MKVKIVLKGKEYPSRVTLGAMLRFKNETGRDVSGLEEGSVSDLILFLWCCVASACRADGVEFAYGVEEFADLIEPDALADFYAEAGADAKKKTLRRPE